MTATLDLMTRTQQWLMDEGPAPGADGTAFLAAQIREQLAIEASRLANRNIIGAVAVIQGVTNRHYYPLDAVGVLVTSGTATGGSVTTLVDSGKNFVALGVAIGDRVRDLTDGSTGTVTTVAATTLTCAGQFLGGVTNLPVSGAVYLVETPLTAPRVVEVTQVYYNGSKLTYTTEATLDARYDGWETATGGEPHWWLVDSATRPTEVRIVPPPVRTGSGGIQLPMLPFQLPITDNLVIFVFQDAGDLPADTSSTGLPDTYDDVLVYNTAAALAGWQTEYENVPLAQLLPALTGLWMQALGPER